MTALGSYSFALEDRNGDPTSGKGPQAPETPYDHVVIAVIVIYSHPNGIQSLQNHIWLLNF